MVEELLEQEQWSKEKSWDKYLVQLPLFTLLEAKFDQLCLTHPPAGMYFYRYPLYFIFQVLKNFCRIH